LEVEVLVTKFSRERALRKLGTEKREERSKGLYDPFVSRIVTAKEQTQTGRNFCTLEKGLDCWATFHLNRKKGKLR